LMAPGAVLRQQEISGKWNLPEYDSFIKEEKAYAAKSQKRYIFSHILIVVFSL